MDQQTSVNQTKIVSQLPVNRYSKLDSLAFEPLTFATATVKQIAALIGINERSAATLTALKKSHKRKPQQRSLLTFISTITQRNA